MFYCRTDEASATGDKNDGFWLLNGHERRDGMMSARNSVRDSVFNIPQTRQFSKAGAGSPRHPPLNCAKSTLPPPRRARTCMMISRLIRCCYANRTNEPGTGQRRRSVRKSVGSSRYLHQSYIRSENDSFHRKWSQSIPHTTPHNPAYLLPVELPCVQHGL